jgi:putative membrane protein
LAFVVAAILVGLAATARPVDRLADASFTWHMAQHLTLLYFVTLLVLLARPFEIFARFAGKAATARFVRATQSFHVLASPPVALGVFVGILWLTHFSRIYELSLENEWLHAGEHFLYLVAGVAFWLPVLAPPPLRPPSYPARMLYLALVLPQGALLAMALGDAREPLYSHYASVLGFGAGLQDQRDAAALMWIVGGLIVFAAFLITLGRWACRESAA